MDWLEKLLGYELFGFNDSDEDECPPCAYNIHDELSKDSEFPLNQKIIDECQQNFEPMARKEHTEQKMIEDNRNEYEEFTEAENIGPILCNKEDVESAPDAENTNECSFKKEETKSLIDSKKNEELEYHMELKNESDREDDKTEDNKTEAAKNLDQNYANAGHSKMKSENCDNFKEENSVDNNGDADNGERDEQFEESDQIDDMNGNENLWFITADPSQIDKKAEEIFISAQGPSIHTKWDEMKAYQKLVFYWEAITSGKITANAVSNFKLFHTKKLEETSEEPCQPRNVTRVWESMGKNRQIPFEVEALIAKIAIKKVG